MTTAPAPGLADGTATFGAQRHMAVDPSGILPQTRKPRNSSRTVQSRISLVAVHHEPASDSALTPSQVASNFAKPKTRRPPRTSGADRR